MRKMKLCKIALILFTVIFTVSPTEYTEPKSELRAIPRKSYSDVPRKYVVMIMVAEIKTGVPYDVIRRILKKESSFNTRAFNKNKTSVDRGIAQINSNSYPVFVELFNGGVYFDPYNPEVAIMIAAKFLADNFRVLGDWKLAAAAYNCGLGRVMKNRIPNSTKEYVREIFAVGY